MAQRETIRELVQYGMLIAIVFIATYLIQFQLPIASSGGLVHAGNIVLFAIAMSFGPKKGAVAGAFGMALFDIFSAWAMWAPGTFIIRGGMGFIIGVIFSRKNNGKKSHFLLSGLAILLSSLWMIAGYYLYEAMLFGNWLTPLNSIPGDLTQIAIGWLGAMPLYFAIKKTPLWRDK